MRSSPWSRHPTGRAALVSPRGVALPDAPLGFRKGILVRDPDGHAMQVTER